MAGTTAETAIRVLGRLRDMGKAVGSQIFKWAGNHVVIWRNDEMIRLKPL